MRLLNNRPHFIFSLILLAAAIGFAGCTRKTGSATSINLKIAGGGGADAKTVSAMSDSIDAIIINVTGSGISAPIFYQWTSHSGGSNVAATPPDSISLSVPNGDGRLVQALMLIKSGTGGGGGFYYADATISLSGGDTSVPLTVLPIGSASTGDDNIAGRYLTSATGGPSGKISVYYPVPNKPRMLVDNNQEMFNGWFRVFAIEGAQLDYVVSDGTELFGMPVGEDSTAVFGPVTAQNLRVSVPAYYNSQDGGTTHVDLQSPRKAVYGFFGSGVSGQQVCFNNSSGPISYAYQDASSSLTLNWNPHATVPGAFDAYIAGGGSGLTPSLGSLCQPTGSPTPIPFVDYLALNDAQVTSGDSALGFKGPFQIQPNLGGGGGGGSTLSTSYTSGTLTVNWTYLPGVQTSGTVQGIDGVDIFGRAETAAPSYGGNQDYNGNNDSVLCAQLTTLANKFTYLGTVSAVDSSQAFTASSLPTGLSTAYSSGSTTTIACPFASAAGKIYFNSAAVADGGSMGGGGGPPATSFTIVTPQFPGQTPSNPVQIANTVCTHFQVQGLNGALPAMFPSSTNFYFTPDTGTLHVFKDTTCTNSISAPISYGGTGVFDFYMLDVDTSPTAHVLSVAATGGLSLTRTVHTISQAANTSPPNKALLINAPASIIAYSCYPVSFESWNFDNAVPANTVPQSISGFYPMLPIQTGLQFYTDGQCSVTGGSMIYFYTSQSQAPMSFRYSLPTPTTLNLQPTSGVSGVALQGGAAVTVTEPSAVTQLSLNVNSSMPAAGNCMPVQLNFADSNGNPAPASVNATITLSSPGGTFYQYNSSTCTTPISGVTILASQPSPSQTFYFQPTTAGPVTLTATSDTPVLTGTYNLSVGPAVANQIVALFPGQSLSGTAPYMVPPNPSGQGYGSTFPVDLYALKYDGTVDTTYNFTLQGLNSGIGFQTLPSCGTVTFASGHASFMVTTMVSGASYAYLGGYAPAADGSTMSFNSASLPLVPMATQFSIYANNFTALTPNTCQIFMVVPEDANGLAATPTAPVTVNLSAGANGGIYSDYSCTSSVTAYGFGPTDNFHVFYLKGNSSSAGVVSTAAVGYTSATTSFSVAPTGAPATASNWQIIGRQFPSHTLAGQCNPYVVYLSDTSGNSVIPGGVVNNLRVQMTVSSGTTGYFNLGLPCNSGSFIDGANQTMYANPGFRAFFGAAPPNPSSTEGITVNDATSTYAPSISGQVAD